VGVALERDTGAEVAERARVWTQRARARFCDRVERWDHGVVTCATRFPRYFDLNVVRVHDDPQMTVDELVAFADHALEGLEHRRIDFDRAAVAEPLRDEFHARNFQSVRLVLMRFQGERPSAREFPITEVTYETVDHLRRAWHQEDFPGRDDSEAEAQAREVRLTLGSRVFALHEDGEPVAFAALDVGDDEAEVAGLYVLRRYRGQGRGTMLTKAAIAAAGGVRDLWICADDQDRPRRLYARLGFRPVVWWTEFLRLPS
jgi:GNAT superfamily N-acetyltransferase